MKKNVNKRIFIEIGVFALLILIVGYLLFADVNLIKEKEEDLDIYFFTGGSIDSAFSGIVYNGAKDAAENLGLKINYVDSGWDGVKLKKQFDEIFDKNPDIIIILGSFAEEEEALEIMKIAESRGILITFWNSDNPFVRKKNMLEGTGYVGQETYSSGEQLALYGIVNYDLDEEDSEAIVFGVIDVEDGDYTARELRTLGILEGLRENDIKVNYYESSHDEGTIANIVDDVYEKFKDNENVKAVFIDDIETEKYFVELMKREGIDPDRYVVSSFDLFPEVLDFLEDGYVDYVSDQQPYLQGYLPVLNSYLTKKYGFPGFYVDTGSGIVRPGDARDLKDLVDQKIR